MKDRLHTGQTTVDDMVQALAVKEYEMLSDGDLVGILIDGCDGLKTMPEDEIREMYNDIFGGDNER